VLVLAVAPVLPVVLVWALALACVAAPVWLAKQASVVVLDSPVELGSVMRPGLPATQVWLVALVLAVPLAGRPGSA
jgi:hypothetical protein